MSYVSYGTLFYRLIVRPLRHEPLRTLLTSAAVALGVAVVLAIELAGGAAAGSFRSSMETLTGNADLEVSSVGGVTPQVLTRLALLPYALKLDPRIEDYTRIAGTHRTVPLIAVDLLASAGSREDAVWLSASLGHRVGDSIQLEVNDTTASFTVRGIIPEATGDVVLMDLATATRVLSRDGKLDRILIHTPAGRSAEEWKELLQHSLPIGATVTLEGARTDENRKMLEAFRWNLRVLSYIALVVGAFLIYNTISVSVVRRRAEIGMLRALGATRPADPAGVSGRGGLLRSCRRARRHCTGTRDGGRRGETGGGDGGVALREQHPGRDLAHLDAGAGGIWQRESALPSYRHCRRPGRHRWWRRWKPWRAGEENMKFACIKFRGLLRGTAVCRRCVAGIAAGACGWQASVRIRRGALADCVLGTGDSSVGVHAIANHRGSAAACLSAWRHCLRRAAWRARCAARRCWWARCRLPSR